MRIFMPHPEDEIDMEDVCRQAVGELFLVDLEDIEATMLADIDATLLTDVLLQANREDPELEIYRAKARRA
jgi:hypothetical protein